MADFRGFGRRERKPEEHTTPQEPRDRRALPESGSREQQQPQSPHPRQGGLTRPSGNTLDDLDQQYSQKGQEAGTSGRHFRQRSSTIKAVLLLDATGSMAPTIQDAKRSIGKIYPHIQETLPHITTIFTLGVFRDYCDNKDIFSLSDPSSDAKYLTSWLEQVRTFGGGDMPEAIEYALKQIIQNQELPDLLLLAGDAPSHTRQEINDSDTRTAVEVAAEFGQRNIPIYTFVVRQHPETVRDFTAIAKASGGASGMLDGGDAMLQMIAMAILNKAGGGSAVSRFAGQLQLTAGAEKFRFRLTEGKK
jgi:Mg-chelatase subunit ChlD